MELHWPALQLERSQGIITFILQELRAIFPIKLTSQHCIFFQTTWALILQESVSGDRLQIAPSNPPLQKWKLGKAAFGELHWQILILRGAEWCSCSPWCQNSAWEWCKWGLDVWEEKQIPGAALHPFRYLNTFNHVVCVIMVQWNIRQMYQVGNLISVSVRNHRKSDFRLCIF